MTSSSPVQTSDQGGSTDTSGGRHFMNNPVMLKEELRQSIIAKRHARGEKQLKIEYREPQQMELTPAEVEKKERRREQNRRAAQRCRHKKRLNQKHVIQNYEQIVARNEQLETELDAVKRELDKLKNTCDHHYMCCPSFSKVNPQPGQTIKLEPMSVEELQNANNDEPVCQTDYSIHKENCTDISRLQSGILNTRVFTSGPDRRTTSSGVPERGTSTVPNMHHQQVGVAQLETNFLQQPHSNSADINQEHEWSYTPCFPDQNIPPTLHLFSGLNPDIAAFLMSTQLHVNSHKYKQQKQGHELQPQQQVNIENAGSNQTFQTDQAAAMPSSQPVSTQRYAFFGRGVQLQSQSSPCQVVPSLRSPRPESVTSTTSCSYGTIRHRSLSGGSGCASDTSRRCRNEREFSSVSSEGSLSIASMYPDMRTLEVLDMDTDDVFMNTTNGAGVPLDGHDDNNNLETLPDNNIDTELLQLFTQNRPSVIDWLSTSPESTNNIRDDTPRASDPDNDVLDSDDVNPLIQLSSDDLQLFSDIENSGQSYDILSTILSGAQRVDY